MELPLRPSLLLLLLDKHCPRLDQSIFDRPNDIYGKHRPGFHRPWYGFLPRFEHALHVFPCLTINKRVRIHERLVQVLTQIDCIRGANIFHDGV